MATSTIKWNEGDGNIVATYEGSGDGPISLTTDIPNEGIDREQEITIQTTDKNKSVNVLVKQEGLREVFATTDGFILADGGTFNVLKVGGDTPDVPEPAETYTRLTYIESTGAQYINTGYIVQEDDIIEMQYTKPERTTVIEYMFGVSDSKGNLWAYINSNSIYPRFGSDNNPTMSSTRWKNVITIQRGSVSIDGTTGTLDLDAMPQAPLYIFARNNNGTATGFATIKSTGCTITKASGEVVMKLRPCKRNADGVVGMIDLVSGQFFENLGKTEFSYGGEAHITEGYEIIDYVTFQEDKVFETGVYANEITYVEVLFRRTDTTNADYLYGATSTTSRRFTAYLTSSGYWRYGSSSTTFNTKDKLLHYAFVTPGKIIIDNSTKTFTASEFTSPHTIPVGGYTPVDGIPVPNYVGHLYYFRMWHDTEVVADLMPCKRLSDSVEGFWDCVSQQFVEPI